MVNSTVAVSRFGLIARGHLSAIGFGLPDRGRFA
jgi:hypothetical protein